MGINYKKLFERYVKIVIIVAIITVTLKIISFILSLSTGIIPYAGTIIDVLEFSTSFIFILGIGISPNLYYGIKYREYLTRYIVGSLLFKPFFGIVFGGSIE